MSDLHRHELPVPDRRTGGWRLKGAWDQINSLDTANDQHTCRGLVLNRSAARTRWLLSRPEDVATTRAIRKDRTKPTIRGDFMDQCVAATVHVALRADAAVVIARQPASELLKSRIRSRIVQPHERAARIMFLPRCPFHEKGYAFEVPVALE